MYSYGPPHMAVKKQDDQHEHTFSSYVRIRDVVLKTYLGRWTIGRSGKRGSGISVLPARYDDDDEGFLGWFFFFFWLFSFRSNRQVAYHKLWYKNQPLKPEKIFTNLGVDFYHRAKIETFITEWSVSETTINQYTPLTTNIS